MVRKLFVGVGSAVGCLAAFAVFFPPLVLWPTVAWRLKMATLFARAWSRITLLLAGIRFEVEGGEHLARVPAVFLFNHTSSVDFFVNACLANTRCLVWGKRELGRVPFMGWMWYLGGHPLVARQDRARWERTVARVEELVGSGRFSTFVAPEGHRSKDGRLLPFKKGAFHVALAARAPIVPIVLHDVADLADRRGKLPRPGRVRVQVLEPVPTTDWSEERLDEHVAHVRRLYLEALGQTDAAQPAEVQPDEAT